MALIKEPLVLPHNIKSDPTLEWFVSQCHKRRYAAKTTIIFAGDKAETLYFLIKGSVSVLIEDDDGRELVLAYLNSGDFFGEMGLFDRLNNRSAWVRTKVETDVAEISYARFQSLVKEHPEIMFRLAEQMALRLRKTSRKVGDLAFMDVTGRVARALLDLAKEPDAMTHPDGMQIKVTRQELGKIVGCSREMVGRVLKVLAEQEHISVKGKTMVIFGTR